MIKAIHGAMDQVGAEKTFDAGEIEAQLPAQRFKKMDSGLTCYLLLRFPLYGAAARSPGRQRSWGSMEELSISARPHLFCSMPRRQGRQW